MQVVVRGIEGGNLFVFSKCASFVVGEIECISFGLKRVLQVGIFEYYYIMSNKVGGIIACAHVIEIILFAFCGGG